MEERNNLHGKKCCASFALDPKDYENSKYFFKDVSDVKKYEKTPLLMKITSPRKVKYTKELLEMIFANNGLANKNVEVNTIDRLCNILSCKVEDIMEHFPDDNMF